MELLSPNGTGKGGIKNPLEALSHLRRRCLFCFNPQNGLFSWWFPSTKKGHVDPVLIWGSSPQMSDGSPLSPYMAYSHGSLSNH